MKAGEYDWNVPGVIDDLKAWWAESYSCSLIAVNIQKKYGGYPTRNAVIGKVTRLGLPTHKNVPGCPYCSFHYRVTHAPPRKITRAEFERNRILGLRATERLRVKREASA